MTTLDAWLEATTAAGSIPGVSIAALRSGNVITERCFGIRGTHDPSPVDAQTVFEAASLTKPLVSFIALQLVDEGLLDLDVPLQDLCGEYVPNDTRAHRITSRHVLTHTSGLPNIVREAAPLQTYFAPGERFSYGSSAFAWLQRAMQTVADRPLEALALQAGSLLELRRRDAQVREAQASDEHHRLLAENASDVVLRRSLDGRMTWISSSVEAALGWKPHEMLGLAVADWLHPDDLPGARVVIDGASYLENGDEVRIATNTAATARPRT